MRLKPAFLLTFLMPFLLVKKSCFSQTVGSSYKQQTRSLLVYNVAVPAIISGIGAVINSGYKVKWYTAFLKGFAGGAAGGYCIYQSKNLLHQVTVKENIAYNWPSKLLFSLGESITENAAASRKIYERFHLNLWLTRVDFEANKGFRARIGLQLNQLIYPTIELIKGAKFDAKQSLYSGLLIFDRKGPINYLGGAVAGGYSGPGFVVIDNQLYDSSRFYPGVSPTYFKYQAYSHEFVHTLQFFNFSAFRGYGGNESTLKDAPPVYADIFSSAQQFLQTLLYLAEGQHAVSHYYRNFFEFEAEYFSTKQQVPIH